MRFLNAALAGLIGSLAGFAIYESSIWLGIAPFNISPFVVYLQSLNIGAGFYGAGFQVAYGIFWSILLVWIFQANSSGLKGVGLALVLWLIMGFVYAPFVGWGPLGFSGNTAVAFDHPQYLKPGPWFLIITLIHYLVYGYIIGTLNGRWIRSDDDVAGQIRKHSEL